MRQARKPTLSYRKIEPIKKFELKLKVTFFIRKHKEFLDLDFSETPHFEVTVKLIV